MASVRWSLSARNDFREAVEYISRDSPTRAERFALRILAAADRLARFPLLGRVVPEYQHTTVRELLVGRYRLMYRIEGDTVTVLAVLHGHRELRRHLPEGPWDIQ